MKTKTYRIISSAIAYSSMIIGSTFCISANNYSKEPETIEQSIYYSDLNKDGRDDIVVIMDREEPQLGILLQRNDGRYIDLKTFKKNLFEEYKNSPIEQREKMKNNFEKKIKEIEQNAKKLIQGKIQLSIEDVFEK